LFPYYGLEVIKGLAGFGGIRLLESVFLMTYWVGAAVGGSLMFISHIIFAYHFFYGSQKKRFTVSSFLTGDAKESCKQLNLIISKC